MKITPDFFASSGDNIIVKKLEENQYETFDANVPTDQIPPEMIEATDFSTQYNEKGEEIRNTVSRLLYDKKYGIGFLIAFIALIGIIFLLVTPELRARLEDKFQMGAQSNSYLIESITGVQTVKSLGIEGSMFKKWEDKLGKYIKSSFNLSIMGNFTGSITKFLQKLMTIAILYVGVCLVIENKLTIGQLIAFQMRIHFHLQQLHLDH